MHLGFCICVALNRSFTYITISCIMASSSAPTSAAELSRDLECPVCQEQYKNPRILLCGHTLCLKPCLEQITRDKSKFKCPECRTEHDMPTAGLEALPKNVAISRMLVGPPKKKCKSNISSCPICDEDDELRKCGHCQVYVCVGCLIEHTPQYKQNLKERARRILVRKEITSNYVKTSAQEISEKIDTAASSAVTLIENKAEELKAAVESARQEELNQVAEMSKTMESSLKSAVLYSTGIIEELENKENISPVKLDRINTKLSESEITLNGDLKSLVNQKNIDISLNIAGLETALKEINVIRSRKKDQKKVDVRADKPSSPSEDQSGQASAGASSLQTKEFSKIKMFFDSANPNRVSPSCPRAVAIDPNNGDLAVTDTGNNRVERYNARGKLLICFGTHGVDQLSNPGGLVINDQGQVIVCDTGNNIIRIYNKDGSHCRNIGRQGSNVRQFSFPCDLALDCRGSIHVCDKGNGRIQVLTQDGTYLCQYQPAGCTQPECICITSDGTICVGDKRQCVILNAYFQCISKWTIGKSWCASIHGMCVYGDDCIMVSYCEDSNKTSSVRVFDFDGKCLKSIANKYTAQTRGPRGIAVDKHGDVYVTCQTVVLKF